jgi:hypothetical protein
MISSKSKAYKRSLGNKAFRNSTYWIELEIREMKSKVMFNLKKDIASWISNEKCHDTYLAEIDRINAIRDERYED